MSKKVFNSLYVFIILFLFVNIVSAKNNNEIFMIEKMANTSSPKINDVTISGNIATIKSTGTVSGYYIGTKDSINDSTTYSVSTNSNNYYVGVKNGVYYFWVYGGSSVTGSAGAVRFAKSVTVTSSCSNQTVSGATGSGTVERCLVSNNSRALQADASGNYVTCASGYHKDENATKVVTNNCTSLATSYSNQQLVKAYCKIVYSYTCVKDETSTPTTPATPQTPTTPTTPTTPVAAATLSSLSISSGSLSPGFSSSTKSYTASVSGDVSKITISATAASGSSFVSGYGARTVNLNYGSNKIAVKVKNSAGSVTTYNIVVTRVDSRSSVNTISNITISTGSMTPSFTAANTTYKVSVASDVDSITIGASLTDGSSSFVDGYGPRTINLNPGVNNVLLKVNSQNGHVKVYTLTIIKDSGESTCTSNVEKYALLKSIELKSDLEDVKIPQLEFDPSTFTYNIKVPYSVGNLTVEAYVQEEGDKVTIVGGDNLEVNIEQDIQITVQSRICNTISKVYHIGVTRQEETELSNDAEIKSMTITNHDEFKFEQNTEIYNLKLNRGETKLDIKYETENENTTCNIDGNENLTIGDEIIIKCISENEQDTVEYRIKISGVKKGTNIFLIILIVLLVIILIAYFILRLLGYKIYFNFALVGAFFRGIGEKIKNIFDK